MWRVRGHSEDAGLLAALAVRGIAFSDAAEGCDAELVACDAGPSGPNPRLVLVRGDDAAVAAMLDAGADDAIARDASPALIAARMAALLRRQRGGRLVIGDLAIDRAARRVTRAGQAIVLLPREFALLLHLADHAGQVVSRAALLRAVWGLRIDPGTNVLAVHVSRLRARLDQGCAEGLIETVPGHGYRLVVRAPKP